MQITTTNSLQKGDILLWVLSFLYMLHNSPYIGVRVPAVVYASLVILLFSYVCVLFSRYNNIISFLLPLFALLILDIVFLDIQKMNSTNDLLRIISGTLQTFILPLISGYCIYKGNPKLALYMLLTFLIIEFLTYVTSIYAESIVPGIIRMNPGQLRDDDIAMYSMKTSLNVGDFNTVYGCASLVPIGILVLKWRKELFSNRFFRLLSIAIPLLMAYFVYISQFTTALVGTVLMCSTVFCPKNITKKFFRGTLVFGLLLLLFSMTILPSILHSVSHSIDSEIMAERFEGIANTLEGRDDSGSLDIELRKDAYEKPIQAITSTFMLGTWSNDGNGGHSHILDTLGKYGFVGLILLIVFYRSILKLFFVPYRSQPWSFYYLYGLLGVTFFYIFNPSELFIQVLFCYPLSAFLINNKLKTR